MPITVQTDFAGIEAAILAWFETYTGLGAGKVMWLNQKTSRLPKPYGTLYVLSSGLEFGLDEDVEIYNAGSGKIERTTTGPRQMVVQAEVYSEPATVPGTLEARHYLQKALASLKTQPVIDAFNAANIGIFGHSPANALDQQLGERWERRSQSDLNFVYTSAVFDDSQDWIETAPVPTEKDGTATYEQ